MNAPDTQARIAEALKRTPPLSFAECNALLLELNGAKAQIGDRLARIHPGGDGGRTPVGKEYLAALQAGTAEDVRRLDDEYREASTLAKQLQAQGVELNSRRTAARLREALEGMPAMQARLVEKLDAAEQAKAALKQALAAVEAVADGVAQARAVIRMAHQEPTGGASIGTIRRLGALHSAFGMDDVNGRYEKDWLSHVGSAISHELYVAATSKAPDVDLSECASEEDVMRAVVEAFHGPVRLDEINALPANDQAHALNIAFQSIGAEVRERWVA